MKPIFDLNSPVMQVLAKTADLMLLNVVFLVFCLPVVTIGTSCTALYRVLLNMEKDTDTYLIQQFWQAFRSNFRQTLLLFLILLIPLILVFYYFTLLLSGIFAEYPARSIPFLVPVLFVCFVWTYVWPLQAQFENTIGRTLRNAFVLSVANLPITVLCTALNLLLPTLFLFLPEFFMRSIILWVLMGFSLTAMINTKLILRIFRRFFPQDASGSGGNGQKESD